MRPVDLLQTRAWGTQDVYRAEELRAQGRLSEAARTYYRAAWRLSTGAGWVSGKLREVDRALAYYGAALAYREAGDEVGFRRAVGDCLQTIGLAYGDLRREFNRAWPPVLLQLARRICDELDIPHRGTA
jgi:hypothetical protein